MTYACDPLPRTAYFDPDPDCCCCVDCCPDPDTLFGPRARSDVSHEFDVSPGEHVVLRLIVDCESPYVYLQKKIRTRCETMFTDVREHDCYAGLSCVEPSLKIYEPGRYRLVAKNYKCIEDIRVVIDRMRARVCCAA